MFTDPNSVYSDMPPQGFESTLGSIQDPPQIASSSVWDRITGTADTAVGWLETVDKQLGASVINTVKKDYDLVKGGATQVIGDVASPIQSSLNSTYWYLIVGIIVIAGALYFIGKGGAIKVNAIV